MGEIPVKCFLRLLSFKTTNRDADAVQPQRKAQLTFSRIAPPLIQFKMCIKTAEI